MTDLPTPRDRERFAWWAFVLLLALAVAFIAWEFVGMLVLGVFGYYAVRPIANRVRRVIGSRSLAATITVLGILVPLILLLALAAVQTFSSLTAAAGDSTVATMIAQITGLKAIPAEQRLQLVRFIQNPTEAISFDQSLWSNVMAIMSGLQAAFGGLLLISLSATFAWVLLANDDRFSDNLLRLFGGEDSVAYSYAVAVDSDLQSVFFGNFLFAVLMAAVATASYWITNMVAPEGLQIPMVVILGLLTGAASLIPIVVGKVVYVPVVAALGFQATQQGGASLAFVGAVLVAYVLVLDLIPQSIVQPYITGQRIEPIMLLFAYLIGPILFGWYGFFLMPVIFVVVLETIRIVVPELIHDEPLNPEPTMAEETGTDPEAARERRDEPGTDDDDAPDESGDEQGSDDQGSGDPTGSSGPTAD